jgi:hypothetical protein
VFNANYFDSISEDGECTIIVEVKLAARTVVNFMTSEFNELLFILTWRCFCAQRYRQA